MLKNEVKYSLDEFVIIERSGELMWVSHMPFGVQRSGQCYIHGNILVMLPWDHEEPGYLKLEFHECLNTSPRWNKTLYYCFASALQQVSLARGLAVDEIRKIINGKIDNNIGRFAWSGSFQLRRYKITLHKSSIISWLSVGGGNNLMGGACFIESDILFLGPQENESATQQRRLFLRELKLLPLWDQTVAWGHAGSLKIGRKCKDRGTSSLFLAILKSGFSRIY